MIFLAVPPWSVRILIPARKEGLELIDPARKATSQGDALALETQAYDAATSLVSKAYCVSSWYQY